MAMRFRNYGGNYQFRVQDERDLARIDSLDPARWAATSAPVSDLHCDPKFLAFLDPENTGRVRHSQVIAARDWLFERLAKKDVVRGRKEAIAIDAIADSEDGVKLAKAAKHIVKDLEAKETDKISLALVRQYKGGYTKQIANGDGVVPPSPVADEAVKTFMTDVIEVVGSTPDRSGADGVGLTQLDEFAKNGKAWVEWKKREGASHVWDGPQDDALALVNELGPKLEEYFVHSELLRQESPAPELLHLREDDLRALRARDKASIEAHLASAPIADPRPDGVLLLDSAINAVFRDKFAALVSGVLKKALGENVATVSRADWAKAKAALEPWSKYKSEKPAQPFEKLGVEKIEEYLKGPLPEKVRELIAQDQAAQEEIERVDELEKLLLYVRWMVELTNNFVNFSAVYLKQEEALVDAGSLVIDGRRVEFCMKVKDRAAHKPVAQLSLCFLVYVKVTEKDGSGESFEVVAPVTSGERGRLKVGKRGIFIDLEKKEWDAQIVEVVEGPISVKEAALAPFRRGAEFLGQKIEEWVGGLQRGQEAAMRERVSAGVTAATTAAESVGTTPPAAAAAAPAAAPAAASAAAREPLNINSLVVGGGVALAGIGAIFASVFSALTRLSGWLAVLAIVAGVLAISALFGWLKLRKRDVSLLFEASGWAVNIEMRVNRRVAQIFSFEPKLPSDAQVDHVDALPPSDEEAEDGGSWLFVLAPLALAVFVALAWMKWGHLLARH